jgi:predicted NAD-dependent protein-ADP-ribosyltransferase YbiA (DUF1768 family)
MPALADNTARAAGMLDRDEDRWRGHEPHCHGATARSAQDTKISPAGSDARAPRVAIAHGRRVIVIWVAGHGADSHRVAIATGP